VAKNVTATIDGDGAGAGTTSFTAGKPEGRVERDSSFSRITFASSRARDMKTVSAEGSDQSALNAAIGSTRLARRAGR
jgi:hypothetical protein